MSEAGRLIRELKDKGLSYTKIGKLLGRDPSLVSQIARGKKPGKNLVKPLEQFRRGETPAAPEVRRTKAGEVAKVRQSKKPPQAGPKPRLLKDKEGRIKNAPESESQRVFLDRLGKIASAGGKVSFRIRTESGAGFMLFDKGGMFAQRVQYEVLNHEAGAFDWLREKMMEMGKGFYRLAFADAEKVVAVEINAIY